MAADAYLLNCAKQSDSLPVLRLYLWERPSITIGYHQKFARAVDCDRLDETPVVRRITGGRALLHGNHEITYSVSGNFTTNPEFERSLHERYRAIAEAIVLFYQHAGWDAEMSHRDVTVSLGKGSVVQKGCFSAVSHYEILVAGQKVAASSQRYTEQSFIQHGAIKIGPRVNHPAILDSLKNFECERPEILGEPVALFPDLVRAFEATFGITSNQKSFSQSELRKIAELEGKYENLNNG